MKLKLFLPALMLMIILPGLVLGQTYDRRTGDRNTAQSDTDFMASLLGDGVFEIQIGKEALNRSNNMDVRKFAEEMISDHSETNNSLKSIARMKYTQVPVKMDKRQEDIYYDLTRTRSDAFDKDFIDIMVNDHRMAIGMLQGNKDKIGDPSIKAWIEKTLPVIKKHLIAAEELQMRLKNK